MKSSLVFGVDVGHLEALGTERKALWAQELGLPSPPPLPQLTERSVGGHWYGKQQSGPCGLRGASAWEAGGASKIAPQPPLPIFPPQSPLHMHQGNGQV